MRSSDLEERIYNLVLRLVTCVRTFNRDMASNVIAKQLFRSGTSVGANYIEAQGGSSRKDFANFIHHSLKSAKESIFWLRLAKDTKSVKDVREIDEIKNELVEISKILATILIKVKNRK